MREAGNQFHGSGRWKRLGRKWWDLGFEDELGDDDGVFFRDGAGFAEVNLQVRVGVRHAHGGAAQHVRRTHQTGEADTLAEVDGRL